MAPGTAAVTLKSYTDRIREIVRAQSRPVMWAGHSMGGIATTQAAEDWPEQIAALVQVCAFLPGNGEPLLTWASQDRESMVNCSNEDAAFAHSRLVAQSGAPLGTPVETTPERWENVRSQGDCRSICRCSSAVMARSVSGLSY